jgi:hypothetical protein
MRAELERIAPQSGKLHRVIAAAAHCTETTLSRPEEQYQVKVPNGNRKSNICAAFAEVLCWLERPGRVNPPPPEQENP